MQPCRLRRFGPHCAGARLKDRVSRSRVKRVRALSLPVIARGRDGGILPGKELAFTFGTLRANDLIWRYVVDSYLKGATPDAFDLLYWDSDSVSLPGPMYCWYTRNTYLENNIKDPGISLQGSGWR
jgi:poly(3-hydroxyalkanoate) synthetase